MTSKAEAARTLERRLGLLEQRIQQRRDRGEASSWDEAEASALRKAIEELRDAKDGAPA